MRSWLRHGTLQTRNAIVACCVLVSIAAGVFIYQPFSRFLRRADLVVVARVIAVRQEGSSKYAVAKPQEILKGKWLPGDTLLLLVHEIPDTGRRSPDEVEVVYDSGVTYFLALYGDGGRYGVGHDPENTRIEIDGTNNNLIIDARSLLATDTVRNPSEKASRYTRLLKSEHVRVRESAAWELGYVECPEALVGLVEALRDTGYLVKNNAAAGLFLLGEKGITSPCVANSIDSMLGYLSHTKLLIRALAVQKGRSTVPYLRSLYTKNHDYGIRGEVLRALTRLDDTTSILLFADAIYSDEGGFGSGELKEVALKCLAKPDSGGIQYADSLVFRLARKALDDKDEYVQISAVALLEARTKKCFGDPDPLSGGKESERARKRVIARWKKWYKDWLKTK